MRLVASLSILVVAATAMAQPQPAPSTVGVDLSRVVDEIARTINADASRMPLSVQVPPSVAAPVCGIDVNTLLRKAGQAAPSCTASSTSAALNQVVQQQVQSNTGWSASGSGTGAAAAATGKQEGRVSVDVSNVAAEIARTMRLTANRVPAVVEVPVDVAAKACAVDADMLSQQQPQAKCVATSVPPEMAPWLQRHLKPGP